MNTRKIESNHFKVFRKLVPDFPDGEVLHEDSPDFCIHATYGVIGVEHCLVHIPTGQKTPLQAIENQTDEIISIAQELAELRGMPAIQATFLFKHKASLKKNQRVELARAIANTIHNRLEQNNNVESFSQIIIRQPDLPEQLSSIQIARLKESPRHFWRCARAGRGIENCIDLLQEAINEKTKLFLNYLQNCSECWLLMVAEIKPSSFIHPNQETMEHTYSSPFKRTYFLDLALGQIQPLKTQ